MKCLPHSKVPLAAGMVLHDCHAEVMSQDTPVLLVHANSIFPHTVLAIRAFNWFVLSNKQ